MTDRKKIIVSILLIAGVNIFGIASWWFTFSHILKESDYIATVRGDILATERRLDNVRSLSVLLKNIENEKEKVSSVFLNQKSVVKLIEELEFLSQKAGVEFAMKTIDLPSTAGEKKPAFQFQTKGSFNDLFHYLILLEDLFYEVEFGRVQFAETSSKIQGGEFLQSQGLWEANFELTLLSYSYEYTD